MSGPDSGPRKHGLTSVLDLGFLQELFLGEHVGEGIKGSAFAQGGQTQRVPDTVGGHFQAAHRGRSLLRSKCRGASHEGG